MPGCIEKILNDTGFDSEIALLELNEVNILNIEEFVQKNPVILKETIYENRIPFKFLPGHRALLLAIPNRLNNLKVPKKKNKTSAKSFSIDRKNSTSKHR